MFPVGDWKNRLFIRFWDPLLAVIFAGLLSTYYFGLTGTFWAVTGEFTRWGGHLLQLAGIPAENWTYFKIIGLSGNPLTRIDGIMIIGMFLGCLSAALWANTIQWRGSPNKLRYVQGFLGGLIAGFGARLAMGCNLAAFFTGIPQFSLHAWFFALMTAVGAFIGTRVLLLPLFQSKSTLKKAVPFKHQENTATKSAISTQKIQRRFYLGCILFAGAIISALVVLLYSPKLGFALGFGVGFGLLIERAQICFTSAFRDIWLTGRTHLAKAIVLGMAVSAIGIFSYIQLGVAPKIYWAGINVWVGGLLFGFGIVLAGGCETGWMYRATEGQIHFWWVGLGNILGAVLLAASWDTFAPYWVDPFEKINLLETFGPTGGLLLTYAALLTTFISLVFWEKYFIAKRKQNLSTTH